MKKILFTVIVLIFSLNSYSQQESIEKKMRIGVSGYYSYAGTNSIVLGPGLFYINEPGAEASEMYFIDINFGGYWGKDINSGWLTSAGIYYGFVPGFFGGISSQQYYNVKSSSGLAKTDVRLSAEIHFAFFGFLGYRYQHPINNFEAAGISRHAFIFKVPLPF